MLLIVHTWLARLVNTNNWPASPCCVSCWHKWRLALTVYASDVLYQRTFAYVLNMGGSHSGYQFVIWVNPATSIKCYFSYFILQSREYGYVEALCCSGEDQPARLKVYKVSMPNKEDKHIIREILFTNVKCVDHVKKRHGRIVVIKLLEGGDHLSFYANSDAATKKWFRCCQLLYFIPCYVIPKVPEENLVPQSLIDDNNDPTKFGASMLAVCVHTCLCVCACV